MDNKGPAATGVCTARQGTCCHNTTYRLSRRPTTLGDSTTQPSPLMAPHQNPGFTSHTQTHHPYGWDTLHLPDGLTNALNISSSGLIWPHSTCTQNAEAATVLRTPVYTAEWVFVEFHTTGYSSPTAPTHALDPGKSNRSHDLPTVGPYNALCTKATGGLQSLRGSPTCNLFPGLKQPKGEILRTRGHYIVATTLKEIARRGTAGCTYTQLPPHSPNGSPPRQIVFHKRDRGTPP